MNEMSHPDLEETKDLIDYLVIHILLDHIEASQIAGMLSCQQYESNAREDNDAIFVREPMDIVIDDVLPIGGAPDYRNFQNYPSPSSPVRYCHAGSC